MGRVATIHSAERGEGTHESEAEDRSLSVGVSDKRGVLWPCDVSAHGSIESCMRAEQYRVRIFSMHTSESIEVRLLRGRCLMGCWEKRLPLSAITTLN